MPVPGEIADGKNTIFAGISPLSTRLSTAVERSLLASFHAPSRLWIADSSNVWRSACAGAHLYWSPGRMSGRFNTLILS
jgi:hypothetical protein